MAFLLLLSPLTASAAGTVLMLIDMQPHFMKPTSELIPIEKPKRKLIAEQIQLLEWARANEIPVVVIEYSGFGKTIPELKEELEKFKPQQMRRVLKRSDGAFDERLSEIRLLKVLNEWQAEKLIVCGINASNCVAATVEGALQRGYLVYTAKDVIADFRLFGMTYPAETDGEYRGLVPKQFKTRKMLEACTELLEPTTFNGPRSPSLTEP